MGIHTAKCDIMVLKTCIVIYKFAQNFIHFLIVHFKRKKERKYRKHLVILSVVLNKTIEFQFTSSSFYFESILCIFLKGNQFKCKLEIKRKATVK
jgi:hypothetical protein